MFIFQYISDVKDIGFLIFHHPPSSTHPYPHLPVSLCHQDAWSPAAFACPSRSERWRPREKCGPSPLGVPRICCLTRTKLCACRPQIDLTALRCSRLEGATGQQTCWYSMCSMFELTHFAAWWWDRHKFSHSKVVLPHKIGRHKAPSRAEKAMVLIHPVHTGVPRNRTSKKIPKSLSLVYESKTWTMATYGVFALNNICQQLRSPKDPRNLPHFQGSITRNGGERHKFSQ